MKNFIATVLVACIYIGAVSIVLSTVSSLGYGLYLFGSEGLAISVSAWLAFTFWLKAFFGGLFVVITSLLALYFIE